MSKNYYEELSKINVSDHVEKKGRFSYLSWAWAVDVLRKHDPTATWEVIRFEGMPFMKTECGYFVEVAVTVQGVTLSQIHPVLDNSNKPIAKPNAFQINTSIQRCLVKAIALHGLGLYIYAGEDLPMDGPITPEQVGTLKMRALEFAKLRDKKDADVYAALKIQDITKLSEGQATEVIGKLEQWIDKAKEEDKQAQSA
ncbi:Sak single strand annealing protein [Cytobacillus oceanisediminis]|uniref:Sak single strand annealing protein n=1 Tax=Cytobacillus oceanisediminis TaxID=665099 RepID=UPI001C24BA5D|nr:DUF1071 domain-containing protein [Cytobacillus oceanisediminis]MBU8770293.1 DUF1071 domain-containing protein [Cytobacillus oceanisediminis]